MGWNHDALAADLAGYLNSPDLMVWTDMQLGPSGSPRPDVYTIRRSYSKPQPMAFEIKISRSDLRSDTTSGKWQKYLKFAQGVTFAVPDGLCTVADIPETCGLIVRKDSVWRYARRPTLQSVTLPMDACLKLLMDGVNRVYAPREPQPRRVELWNEHAAVRKKFGSNVEKAARDLTYVQTLYETLDADIRERRSTAEAEVREARAKAISEARAELADLDVTRREIAELLGLGQSVTLWSMRHALTKLRAELSANSRVERAEATLQTVRRSLEGALNALPKEISAPLALSASSLPGPSAVDTSRHADGSGLLFKRAHAVEVPNG